VGFALLSPLAPSIVNTTLDDFTLPGSQPSPDHDFKEPSDCASCHSGYGEQAVEPFFNWAGSMMAQSGRDPIFLAAMTIANQDAANSGDLCIRCHYPKGWLEGRSTPTDGSALIDKDREGVLCHFCHKLVDPAAALGNPYPGDALYTSNTYPTDDAILDTLSMVPTQSAHGSYVVEVTDFRRGPYPGTFAEHDIRPSPFHWEASLCATCHDVSNPVFSLDTGGRYTANEIGSPPPSTRGDSLFPIERTYSEWFVSDYNSPTGVYAPDFAGNKAGGFVATCQDCHMRDVTGHGCSRSEAPNRTDLGLHDFTGGNTFVPKLINLAFRPIHAAACRIDGAERISGRRFFPGPRQSDQ
jgi:hypothetical protein